MPPNPRRSQLCRRTDQLTNRRKCLLVKVDTKKPAPANRGGSVEAGGIEPPNNGDVTRNRHKDLGDPAPPCAADTLQSNGTKRLELTSDDPRLAAVSAAWDTLPEPIRAAIGTLVDSVDGSELRPAYGGGVN